MSSDLDKYLMPEELRAPVCEHLDCDSVTVETETIFGHRLTLCWDHGHDIELLLKEGYGAFREWAQQSLKPKARKRWRKRKVVSK